MIGKFDYLLNGHIMTNGYFSRFGVLAARMLAGRDRRRFAREQAAAAAQPAMSL